jgi:hypothetical protein
VRRLSYFDLAGRATASFERDALARAIERLSRTYREGREPAHERGAVDRAAYLVHVLPAHVCDERRLLLEELPQALEDELVVLALGGGPGTEVLAVGEAVAQLAARGERHARSVSVRRVDRVAAWDQAFAPLESAFREALVQVDPEAGSAWTLDAPPTIAADLARPPLSAAVIDGARAASLVVVANLVTELAPRGTPRPPEGFLENVATLARAAPARQRILILDRAHAPGARARIEATLDAIANARPLEHLVPPAERENRCACTLTRATKDLYARVRLETTKVEDKPILTTRTAWALATVA